MSYKKKIFKKKVCCCYYYLCFCVGFVLFFFFLCVYSKDSLHADKLVLVTAKLKLVTYFVEVYVLALLEKLLGVETELVKNLVDALRRG